MVELQLSQVKIAQRNYDLEVFKPEVERKVKESFASLDDVRNQQAFRSYRDFFWRVGIDPTKTRPAAEALTRRILSGKSLPTINTLVDSYNLASVMTTIAIAAFDLNRISDSDLVMRVSRKGERFRGIGMETEIELRGVEVVIEDTKGKNLVAVYPYRDSDDSKVTADTTAVLLLMCGVPGIPLEKLEEAANVSKEYITRFSS